jgi:hypothetical protein
MELTQHLWIFLHLYICSISFATFERPFFST